VWGCREISPFSDFVFYLFCFSFSNFVFCLFLLKKNKKKTKKFLLSIKHVDIGFFGFDSLIGTIIILGK